MTLARLLTVAVALLGSTAAVAALSAADEPVIAVRDDAGAYEVSARFSVPEPIAVVRAVLTDYERIPQFMPGVRTSRVLERSQGRARIEQEAVAKFLMFSKRVHLVLDITEDDERIAFRDVQGKSFASYEGAWTVSPRDERTDIGYRLSARPAFDVPAFVLRRLLDRDARAMIGGLRAEMAARAHATR